MEEHPKAPLSEDDAKVFEVLAAPSQAYQAYFDLCGLAQLSQTVVVEETVSQSPDFKNPLTISIRSEE